MIRDLWYKNAIIYSLSIDSFADANGDGVGDFDGAIGKLDYLQGLGVTAVWLAPFHPSPRRDHGYDVTDYYGVDPQFGTLGDFVEFTHACGQRGIRVIMDLVLNHTSDQHPWFQAAQAKDSPYRDFYVWSDRKPKDAHKGVVFPGVQETTWSHSEAAKAWYFHRFHKFQPDLNMANPAVRRELLKVVGFWIQAGVSGFRLDAVPFLIAREGADAGATEPAYAVLQELREFSQWRSGEVVFLAEANVQPQEAKHYFGERGDRLHMMFNFPVNQTLFYALAAADARPLRAEIRKSARLPHAAQWTNFLRNHDELDLGRLEEGQRQTVFDAFGPEPNMQLYDRGIRRRLAPMLKGDLRRIKLANSLMLTLPGSAVLRYGDEIGMGDDLRLPERDCARTPMQWSGGAQAGFTACAEPARPPIADGAYGYHTVNVAHQRPDPDSLLNWTERAIRLRKELPEIGWGQVSVLKAPNQILALRYDWRGVASVFIHNLAEARIECSIDVTAGDEPAPAMVCLQTDDVSEPDEAGRHRVVLEPYSFRWYRIGGLDTMPGGNDAVAAP